MGEMLVKPPAIKNIICELYDKQNLTYTNARVDWITGVLFTRFICQMRRWALGTRFTTSTINSTAKWLKSMKSVSNAQLS